MKDCIEYILLLAHKGSCTIRGLQGEAKLVVFILTSVSPCHQTHPHLQGERRFCPVLAQERPIETLMNAFSP